MARVAKLIIYKVNLRSFKHHSYYSLNSRRILLQSSDKDQFHVKIRICHQLFIMEKCTKKCCSRYFD